MSTAQQVVIAEQNLEQARQDARKQQVKEAEQQLKQLRADAKELRAELNSISERVAVADRTVTSSREQLYNIDAAIAQLKSNRNADLLQDPQDTEAEVEDLRRLRKQVFARLEAALQRTEGRTRAIDIAKELEHMQYVAANLRNIIAHGGRPRNGWEGGVSTI